MPYVKEAGQGALGEDLAIGKGIEHIRGLPKAQLKKLLRFYFLDRTPNQSKKNRKELVEMVINALEKRQMSRLGESGIGAV
jgi:hypothetical protein